MNFFRHSPAIPQQPEPTRWTPEGLLVPVRYANLVGAHVLLYARALSDGQASSDHGVHCLGCTRSWAMTDSTYPRHLDFQQGNERAAEHASACRALPGPIPARPDDATAVGMLTNRIARSRTGFEFSLHIAEFAADRVLLQRTDTWIYQQFTGIADRNPDLLAVTTDTTSTGTTHTYHQVRPRQPATT
ncbi:hypothetical protein [Streptomyces sp. NRRL WC-3742]|uniref:hypothetical protein n=1 Tax=Streptomyces sp. NRRL WC-3742 TaxID=1463934 RepID=UPI00068C26AB|nr:hypothetical protein [Streptomyces sp. NRRL WC-3742]